MVQGAAPDSPDETKFIRIEEDNMVSTAQAVDDIQREPTWLSRNQDVMNHLRTASTQVREVHAELGGVQAFGRIRRIIGSRDAYELVWANGQDLRHAKTGTIVRFSYALDRFNHEFLAQVVGRGDQNALRFSPPPVVQARDRRAAERVRIPAPIDVRIQTQGHTDWEVFDLSTSGAAIVVPTEQVELLQKDGVRGFLRLPDCTRVAVWLEARHIRDHAIHGYKLVGTRFIGISSTSHTAIERALDFIQQH